jgi:tetratricopeptide (TPR) repeat protein
MSRLAISLLALLWGLTTTLLNAEQAPTRTEWLSTFLQFYRLKQERNYSDAERVLLGLWRAVEHSAPHDERIAYISNELAVLYYQTGKSLESERFFKRALKFWDEHKPTRLDHQAAAVNSLARHYLDEHRPELAQKLYARYQPGWLTTLGPGHPEIASSWNNLGTLHFDRGDLARAEEFFGKSLAIREAHPGSETSYLIVPLSNLASVYTRTGRTREALENFERILSILKTGSARDVSVRVRVNLNMGFVYCELKRFDEAIRCYDQGLQEALNALGPEHPLAESAAAKYARALRIMNRKAEAKQMEKLSRLLREVTPEQASTHQTVDVDELYQAHRR